MASIWLWSAAPLVLVAGSRPVGQSPAKPALSSTVSVPPACPVPEAELVPVPLAELVAAELVAALLVAGLEELPQAVTATQAHTAIRLAPQRRRLIQAGDRPARGRLRGLSPVDPTISPPLSQTTGTGRRGRLNASTQRELPQPGGERVVTAADHLTLYGTEARNCWFAHRDLIASAPSVKNGRAATSREDARRWTMWAHPASERQAAVDGDGRAGHGRGAPAG